jgi:hypothetical protein
MDSGEMIAARIHRLNALEDTVCIQTCKPAFPRAKAVARFMNREAGQLRFYSAKLRFASTALDRFSPRAQHRSYTNKKFPAANDAKSLDGRRLRRHACLQRSTV